MSFYKLDLYAAKVEGMIFAVYKTFAEADRMRTLGKSAKVKVTVVIPRIDDLMEFAECQRKEKEAKENPK